MVKWLKDLDRVLRGEATRLETLRDGNIDIPAAGLSVVICVLAVVYGICMGCFAALRPDGPVYMQMVASAVKVPALFFLTLVVTFPSLYVFNALVGSRLNIASLLRLLVAALGVNVTVLASLGPILAFFSLSVTSYPFMVLLNVLLFAASGGLGLVFLLQTLHRMTVASEGSKPLPLPPIARAVEGETPERTGDAPAAEELVDAVEVSGALEPLEGQILGKQVWTVFACWVMIFGLVGAQMGWVLRPFIGSPSTPFTWFRDRQSNFFEAVFKTIISLFS